METTNRQENSGNSQAGQLDSVPQTTNQGPQTADKQLPVKKFSTGAISATIWRNERQGKDGKVFETHSVNLQRRYANKNGEWMTSNSLRTADVPKALLVLSEAYKYLALNGRGEEATVE